MSAETLELNSFIYPQIDISSHINTDPMNLASEISPELNLSSNIWIEMNLESIVELEVL